MLPDNPPLILIVEDDARARSVLAASLMQTGYRVLEAATGSCGLAEFAVQKPDAVVLDLHLPDIVGTEVVRQLRERSSVPILALADADQDSAAAGTGADAIVSRSVDLNELTLRLRQLLRPRVGNSCQAIETRFTVGALSVDHLAQRVFIGSREIVVSPAEFLLLTTLIHHSGKVVTYRCLTDQIWNSQQYWHIAYLKLLVSGLRRKLEADPAHPRYVLTDRGVGYRMATK